MERSHHIAKTVWANVCLSREERARHVYIVGKSGSGKSTTLFNLAMYDIADREGVAVIDPHGDLAEAVADCIPSDRTHAVCYLDAADSDRPIGFNPLAHIAPERHALAASGIVSAFKHLWRDSWGPRLEHFMFQGVMALLALPRATLIDLPRVYTQEDFRDRAVARLRDPISARFWREEYPRYDDRYRAEAAGPILNKVGQLAASPALRAILGQHVPKFDLSYAMEHRGILIANLAKGRIGEQAANMLGSLLVSHLQLAAMGRSAQPPEDLVGGAEICRAFLHRQSVHRAARRRRARGRAWQCRGAHCLSRLRRRRPRAGVGIRPAAAQRIGRSAAVLGMAAPRHRP
jgi:Type IV secretion-system coupling protein DNA-binding domain